MLGWLAKSALMQSPVGAFLRSVPRAVWIALAGALILGGLVWWHAHKVKAFGNARYAAGYAKAQADAKKASAAVEKKGAEISSDIRSKTDEENGRTHGYADSLRLRGPGRAGATCVPAASGGYDEGRGAADAPVDRLPYPAVGELIEMPFNDLIDRAEKCDLNRSEALAWREWYARISAEWTKTK